MRAALEQSVPPAARGTPRRGERSRADCTPRGQGSHGASEPAEREAMRTRRGRLHCPPGNELSALVRHGLPVQLGAEEVLHRLRTPFAKHFKPESLEDVHHVRHKSRLRTVVRSQKFRFLRQMLDTVQAKQHFSRLAVGTGHCLGVDQKHQIYVWGDAESAIMDHQVGIAASNQQELMRRIKMDFRRRIQLQTEEVADAMAVKHITLALEEEKEYLLEHPHEYLRRRRATPSLVKGLERVQIFDVACGWEHCVVLSCDGLIFTWGAGAFGKLGHGGVWDEPAPRLVEHISKRRPIQIGCGAHHSLCITDNGVLWSWGDGRYGQLGHGAFRDCGVPTRVPALADAGRITSAS